jgi:dolichyl-phosphate beta-glucosyltransferase
LTEKELPFPNQDDLLDLSIIIPAYNEEKRLPSTLKSIHTYMEQRVTWTSSYEILVVDDGSHDDTSLLVFKYAQKSRSTDIRLLKLFRNRGKGGAIARGMLVARGRLLLMADADNATRFSEIENLLSVFRMTDGFPSVMNENKVVIGSRAHLAHTEAVVKRSWIRNLLMKCFHSLVYLLGVKGIGDTQCGFKLFTRRSARILFSQIHVEGWIFDIEILFLAQRLKMEITEIPVGWMEVNGSKVNLIRDSIRMAFDLCILRLNYWSGVWLVDPNPGSVSVKK